MVLRLGFNNSELIPVYEELSRNFPQQRIDLGATSLDYTQMGTRSLAKANDGRIDSAELFEALVSNPKLHAVYRRFASEPLPWEAGTQPATQTFLRRFDGMVARWRKEHPQEPRTGEALVREIYGFVTLGTGLGMRADESAPEMNIDQIVAQGRGDCTEFTKIFLLLLSRAGYSPFPVWVRKDLRGAEPIHIVAAVEVGGKNLLLDPVYGSFNPLHLSVSRISLREFLAWHWNNKALEVQQRSPDRALQYFARALSIDPNNPHFLTNRGIFRLKRGELALAIGNFKAALRESPNFHPALFQMGNVEFDEENYLEAADFYRQAVAQSPRREVYLHNLVLANSLGGDRASAKRVFQELCKIMPAQPELLKMLPYLNQD